jgi:hypothetical protein
MIQAPASRTVVGSPQWSASKGQRISQCGPMGMAGHRLVVGVCVAVLRCAAQHVAKPRRCVGRLRLPFKQILEQLHAQGVETHGRIADDILVARHADPFVCALSQDLGHAALLIHLGDGCVLRNHGRPRAHGACDGDGADPLLVGFRGTVRQSNGGIVAPEPAPSALATSPIAAIAAPKNVAPATSERRDTFSPIADSSMWRSVISPLPKQLSATFRPRARFPGRRQCTE